MEKLIKPDAQDHWLDFGDFDMLPREAEAVEKAEKELKVTREAIVTRKKAGKQHPARKSLPENPEREVVHIYPEGYNPEEWTFLPEEEVIKILMHEPGKFYARRVVRHTTKRKGIDELKTGPLPVTSVVKNYASTSLLADVMIGKYADHIPFHRQLEQSKRVGVHLLASTVDDWFKDVADLLRPLYFRLWELVMQTDYIQLDETTIPVINDERHKTVKGYIWPVRDVMTGRQFFYYDKSSRSKEVVLKLFGKFRGTIQTDKHERYEMLDTKKGIIPLGCWAHARRHFWEARGSDMQHADYALAQIRLLYDMGHKADDERLTYEQRVEPRTRLTYPIPMHSEEWLVNECPKVMEDSPIGKAIKYTYGGFNRLSRHHLDGRYRPDNNRIENKVWPVTRDRHNYLFCGNDDAAEDAAVLYLFSGCCKVVGADFRTWLIYSLGRMHDYDDDYSMDLVELPPDNLLSKNKILSVASPKSPKKDS